jgi:RES domain-containing protein
VLYRVFPFDPALDPEPLAVARSLQGGGRHDNPGHYTALYLSTEPISAVAERIQAFRGGSLTAADLRLSDGRVLAVAALDDSHVPPLLDLDDPQVLLDIGRRPSEVASGRRRTTQALALERFQAGAVGLSWWSTLESDWTNVTLFDVRLPAGGLPTHEITPLTTSYPSVVAAADRLGINVS